MRTPRRGPIVAALALAIVLGPLGLAGEVAAGARSVGQAAAFDCAAVAGTMGTPPGGAATPVVTVATPVPAIPAASLFPAGGGDLTVFAAASLTGAFEEMETVLEG
ncbi:MAG: hypothetical protein WKF80_09750, partial [Thermomicrobiales bacterium]